MIGQIREHLRREIETIINTDYYYEEIEDMMINYVNIYILFRKKDSARNV